MIEKNANEITDYEINFSYADWCERHNKEQNAPDSVKIVWSKWDDLIDFFIGYFNHYGDDVSNISREQMSRIIKTVYRLGNKNGFSEGMAFQKEMTPSFLDQLKDWREAVQLHNREAESESDEHVTFDVLMSNFSLC